MLLRSLRALPALLPLAVVLCLSGCGNNPYPASERREAVYYGVLPDDPKTLDPSVVYDITSSIATTALYVSYFQYHYLKHEPFELELALGAEMPKREPFSFTTQTPQGPRRVNGERWSFRIKKGLRFQDDPCFPGGRGREITAADFIHTFKRIADPAANCPIRDYLLDKIVGLEAFYERQRARAEKGQAADYSLPVEGLQLDPQDPYRFRLVLSQPYPQLRYWMVLPFTSPLAHEATEKYGKGLGKHPVGNGPYVLAEWRPKERLVFRPNPNYRQDDLYPSEGMPGDRETGLLEDAGKRLPLNDGVIYTILREGITSWNFFQQGYLDAYGVTQENYSQVVSRVGTLSPQMAARGITLSRAVEPGVYYLAFNMKDPVVGGYDAKRRKLRQALSLCYDARAEVDLLAAGIGKPADWMVPPGLFSYDPEYRNPYRQTDVRRARALLAEAGYPNGVDPETGERLTLVYDNTGTTAEGRQMTGFFQKQFEQIGVRLQSRSWRVEVWQDLVDRGRFQVTDGSWFADYPDPENFALVLYGKSSRQVNLTGYSRPEYDRLYEQIRSMDDTPERARLLYRMRDMAVEDCPGIYRYYSEALVMRYPWYHNSKSHPISTELLKYRRIDAAERDRLREAWNPPNYWPLAAVFALLVGGGIPAVAGVRRRRKLTARRRARA